MLPTLAQLVHQVLQNITDGTANNTDMRKHFVLRRPRATPPKGKPMLLTSHRTSSDKQLVHTVRTLCEIQAHTRHDLPLCCGIKVPVQLLRFLYSVTYATYNMQQHHVILSVAQLVPKKIFRGSLSDLVVDLMKVFAVLHQVVHLISRAGLNYLIKPIRQAALFISPLYFVPLGHLILINNFRSSRASPQILLYVSNARWTHRP